MRHKLYLDDYTQVGKNRITLPKALANYYGNTAQAYVGGRQVESSVSTLKNIYTKISTVNTNKNVFGWSISLITGHEYEVYFDSYSQGTYGNYLIRTSFSYTATTLFNFGNNFSGDSFIATSNTHYFLSARWGGIGDTNEQEVKGLKIVDAETGENVFLNITDENYSNIGFNILGLNVTDGKDLTFTTPTPTREIEIGRGNLELTDTSSANEVGVLHWTPSSESGYYWVLTEGAAGNTVYVKVAGVWKEGTLYLKTGGSWVQADDVNVKASGTWK